MFLSSMQDTLSEVVNDISHWAPISDRIIVLPEPKKKINEEGISLSSEKQNDDSETWGEVLTVGPGRMLETGVREEMIVKKGNRVLFNRYVGDDFLINPEGKPMPFADLGVQPPDYILIKILRQEAILSILPS